MVQQSDYLRTPGIAKDSLHSMKNIKGELVSK